MRQRHPMAYDYSDTHLSEGYSLEKARFCLAQPFPAHEAAKLSPKSRLGIETGLILLDSG